MKQFLILLFSVFSTAIFADNNANDTLVAVTPEIDSIIISPDDPVLLALDNMMSAAFFKSNPLITDTGLLDISGYCSDTIPVFTDEYYAKKLAELDAATPFNLDYNKNVKGFIKLYTERRRELTSRILGLSHMYFPMFEEQLAKYDLPQEFKYLAIVESALKPTAKSRAGATGLWQFMYRTGKMYHLDSDSYHDDRKDPYLATDAACQYFELLYSMYGNWELVLAAYNCGPGNVNKAIRRSGGKKDYWELWPYLPRETRGYVPAFIAVNYVMNNAAEHNLYPIEPLTTFFEYDTVYVKEDVSFEQISEALDIDMELLAFLNPRYTRKYIPNSEKPNVLYLPHNKVGLFIENEQTVYSYNEPSVEEMAAIFAEEKRVREMTETHTVRNGEYLGLIAERYHVGVSEIKAWNNLRSNNLKIGQKLTIYTNKNYVYKPKDESKKTVTAASSSKDKKYYTIKKGDTLWDVANAKGLSVNELQRLNSNLNFKRLQPGMKIVVSAGS
ncbi:MAG: LysM peptidoglycan-binding domain-containing protein [Flavobacteriales bacterium]|nr:LysM peptidoglycan-binding domain-containing protein [Flavobacteriales bacterium]